jgi:hypothetical protein
VRGVRLVQHPVLAAAVAGDPHEPRGERAERLIESLGAAVAERGAVPTGGRASRSVVQLHPAPGVRRSRFTPPTHWPAQLSSRGIPPLRRSCR